MAQLSRTAAPTRSITSIVRESFITGVAVIVPILVTTFVFAFLFNTLYRYLAFVDAFFSLSNRVVAPGVGPVPAELLLELATPVVVLCGVFSVGFVVERSRYGELAVDHFDQVATRIPGFGSIYESFRQLSDVVLSSDTESFREVKLIEFPHEGSYTLGFVTTKTPDALADATRPAHEADHASEARGRTDARPAEQADRDPDERDRTDSRPAARTGQESGNMEGRR